MVEHVSRSYEVASLNLAHLLLHFKLQSTSSIFFVVLYDISRWSAQSSSPYPTLQRPPASRAGDQRLLIGWYIPYNDDEQDARCKMQDARTQEDGRTAARQQLNTMNNNPMRCGRRRFRSGDHRILHPFCPADSMYEVRGYESRSRCQAEEQEKIRAATTTEEEQELMLRSS